MNTYFIQDTPYTVKFIKDYDLKLSVRLFEDGYEDDDDYCMRLNMSYKNKEDRDSAFEKLNNQEAANDLFKKAFEPFLD